MREMEDLQLEYIVNGAKSISTLNGILLVESKPWSKPRWDGDIPPTKHSVVFRPRYRLKGINKAYYRMARSEAKEQKEQWLRETGQANE